MSDKMLAWECECGGTSYISRDLEDMVTEVQHLAEGDELKISRISISDEELNALPEFDGF